MKLSELHYRELQAALRRHGLKLVPLWQTERRGRQGRIFLTAYAVHPFQGAQCPSVPCILVEDAGNDGLVVWCQPDYEDFDDLVHQIIEGS